MFHISIKFQINELKFSPNNKVTMSLERTPPPGIIPSGAPQAPALPPASALAPFSIEPSACHICNHTMNEGQDCLIITECSHPFHRTCIEEHLTTSAECPVCKRPCQLNELRTLLIVQKTMGFGKPGNRGKGRGALSKHYNTRSASRNLFQESQNQQLHMNSSLQGLNYGTPNHSGMGQNPTNMNSPGQSTSNQVISNTIDYTEINRMIEANLTRLLNNINILPSCGQNGSANNFQNHNSNSQPAINNISHNNTNRPPSSRQNPSLNLFNLSPNTFSHTNSSQISSDKATSIIQSWNLRFDGSSSGLNVEEFLYRIRSLTNDNFFGDFSVILKNLNTLLIGKAKDWYWRYHKQTPSLNWNDFCVAIRAQYKDFKTSYDIREDIRNRKQRANESFDTFFEAISALMDRLPTPMTDEELIEILPRNLRPEIRQELLYVKIHSISHLRQLVQTRENFLSDEYVRRNLSSRAPGINSAPRKYVADIEIQKNTDSNFDSEPNVDALDKVGSHSKCWNCDEIGHHWHDCLRDRTIFCYGCGGKNVYKPNCVDCKERKLSHSKNPKVKDPLMN